MRKLVIGAAAAVLALTGCAAEEDTRVERTTATLEAIHGVNSDMEGFTEHLADQGFFDDLAADLVEGCDDHGDSFLLGYLNGLRQEGADDALQVAVESAWDVACPE